MTEQTLSAGGSRAASRVGKVVGVFALTILGFIAYHTRQGAVSPRIANPDVTGVPRPVEFLFGADFPIGMMQWGTVAMMLALVVGCLRRWRQRPGDPNVLMVLASTMIVWQDPVMNWAPYAVYNPQLWHFPEDWPWVRMSPTVEPYVVIGYSTFYFLGPFLGSRAILRRLQSRASADAFVWRHPLISIGILAYFVGFIMDAILEIFCVHAGLYIYSQVIPWGSLFAGTTFQFPLIWESSLVTLVMIPASVLSYRDDTGRTQAEKLARRLRWFPNHPALGTFMVMAVILNVAYFMYGFSFGAIRASGLATAVACPYPYPEAKVYDPQGFWERAGHPGPYLEGYWNGWMSGQPDGRPATNPLSEPAACR